MALDTDGGVEAKTTAVIPAEHILGFVGFEEAVALKTPEDPGADRVLEALDELGRGGRGFVEGEAGSGIGGFRIRVTLNPLEKPIDYAGRPVIESDMVRIRLRSVCEGAAGL